MNPEKVVSYNGSVFVPNACPKCTERVQMTHLECEAAGKGSNSQRMMRAIAEDREALAAEERCTKRLQLFPDSECLQ